MKIGVKITGTDRFIRDLTEAERNLKTTKIMKIITQRIRDIIQKENFDNQRNENGTRWEPIKKYFYYLRAGRRVLRDSSMHPLKATGTYWRSIKGDVESPTSCVVGTNIDYAIFHEDGKGRKKREVFFLSAIREKMLIDFYTKEILGDLIK